MATYTIRVFGDPVLKRPTALVTDIDGALVKLVDAMYETMYDAPGVGLAASQVGVQKRFFVYDVNDETGPHVVFNPEIVETSGEWTYEEGCLSLPGLGFEITRPKLVTLKGLDREGREIVVEGDELLGRVFLHETDHLDGVLMLDRLDADQRKQAMRELREQHMTVTAPSGKRHALSTSAARGMRPNGMRVVYLGTPADAVPPLRALVVAGHDVALVVTQPDRRRRRGAGTDPSPVKIAATELGLTVRTPEKAREIVDEVRATGAVLGVVVAFGQLLPVPLLEAVPHGFVNLHFSLLPRWRGAAPVERAMLAGDADTGVCLMGIEAGLDTGPVYACTRTPIAADETAGELRARLVQLGTALLVEQMPAVPTTTPEPQQGEPTYAEKLTVDEFRLDPHDLDARQLAAIVRAGNPRPGAWFDVGGVRVKVWRAHAELGTGAQLEPGALAPDGRLGAVHGVLVLDEVQPAGKRAMEARAWLAGRRGDARVDEQDEQ